MSGFNLERAAMKGRLAEQRQNRERLRNRIKGSADAIRTKLNTLLTPVDDLDVPVIDEQWDQLKASWTELAVTNGEIGRLERELD